MSACDQPPLPSHAAAGARSPGAARELGAGLAQARGWPSGQSSGQSCPSPSRTAPQLPPAHHGDPAPLQSGAQAAADALETLLGRVGGVLWVVERREKGLGHSSQPSTHRTAPVTWYHLSEGAQQPHNCPGGVQLAHLRSWICTSHPRPSNTLPSQERTFGGFAIGDGCCAHCPSSCEPPWVQRVCWAQPPPSSSRGVGSGIPWPPRADGAQSRMQPHSKLGSLECSPGKSFPKCTRGREGRGSPRPASPPHTFPLIFAPVGQLPLVLLPGLLLQVEQDSLLLFSRPVHEVIPDLTTQANRPRCRGL